MGWLPRAATLPFMQKPYLITAPTFEALSVASLRSHLNVDFDNDDSLLRQYADSVENAWLEDTGYVLRESVWEESFYGWSSCFTLQRYPVQSITSITYTRADDTVGTVSNSIYRLDLSARNPRVLLKYAQTWPLENLQTGPSIRIRYTAGHTTPEAIPQDILVALMVKVGEFYADRDGMAETAKTRSLTGADRVWRWATTRHRLE